MRLGFCVFLSVRVFYLHLRLWARASDNNLLRSATNHSQLLAEGCGLIVVTDTVSHTIRYDTIGEFNVDWKAEYSALSSTRSQKKKLKQPTPVPL